LVLISGGWILFLSLNRSSRERRLKYLTEPRVRRFLFGAACVVLGLSDLVYLRSTAGTAPAWLAAQVFVFYLFGWGHFAAGLALLFEVVPRLAATLEARMITSFVLLIYIPGVCAAPGNRLQSTMFFMASGWQERRGSWQDHSGLSLEPGSVHRSAPKRTRGLRISGK
jgi:hypothetical protein